MSKIVIVREAAEKAMAAENERTRCLLGRAEKFVAGIVIVTGFELLNAPTLLASASPRVEALYYSALAVLSLSLFFGFYGMGHKRYAGYPRGDKLWENLKSEDVSEDAAERAIVQLLLKTREQNARLNDAKATALSLCRWSFFVGFLLVVSSLLLAPLAVINPPQ